MTNRNRRTLAIFQKHCDSVLWDSGVQTLEGVSDYIALTWKQECLSSVSLELRLERNGHWLLQGHRDVKHPSHALLSAGSTVFGVFKPGLMHSLYYCERYMRSEL